MTGKEPELMTTPFFDLLHHIGRHSWRQYEQRSALKSAVDSLRGRLCWRSLKADALCAG